MTENNDKKYGRTIFDLIGEHPKYTLFIFSTLLCVIIGLLFFRVPLKIGNVEVGNKPAIIHDTITKTKIDTQWVKVAAKTIKINSLPVIKLKQTNKQTIKKILLSL